MNSYAYVAMLVCFMMSVPVSNAADPSDTSRSPAVTDYDRDVIALEKEWASTHKTDYFYKAYELFRSRKAMRKELIRTGKAMQDKTSEFQISQLDIVSGVLLKNRDGTEFELSASSSVNNNQAKIIKMLATEDIYPLKMLPDWPELRTRYVRLLMYQRATWIGLRDPSLALDGEHIGSYSGVYVELDPERDAKIKAARQKRMLLYQRVEFQASLRMCIKEVLPKIDAFMIGAFSIEPIDLRMLNESLAMGLYTPEERAKIVNTVEAATGKKLPLGLVPTAEEIEKEKLKKEAEKIEIQKTATPKVDGEKKP